MLSKNDLIEIGFKNLPHPTIMGTMTLDLGKRRVLSIGCLGTPNETMFLGYKEDPNEKVYSDMISVHNYDFDGYLSKERLISLIEWFKGGNKRYEMYIVR